MGCCGNVSTNPNVKPSADSPINIVLEELKNKSTEITKSFIIKDQKLKDKKAKILAKREEKVKNAIETNMQKKELEELLLKYNKKEIQNEKDFIQNQTDKIHCLYELGIQLADKLKILSVDGLKKKLDSAPSFSKPAINSQIDLINQKSPEDILNSELGEPLKSALEKEGMREDFLKGYMEDLKTERQTRRKEERDKYNLEKNEFPPEDEVQFTAKDLFESIKGEYKDKFFPILDLIESDDDNDE